jgi:hypothetical protein
MLPRFKRSWLRFGTRSLLLLMFVVALLLLLWNPIRAQRSAVAAISKVPGGYVHWDYQRPVETWQDVDQYTYVRYEGTPPGSPWIRKLLGDDAFARVEHVFLQDYRRLDGTVLSSTHDDVLALLPPLSGIKTVHARASDQGLAHLAKMPSLEELYLSGTFTDAGVKQLLALPKLKRLALSSPWLREETLATVCQIPGLQELHVIGFGYSDADERKIRRTLFPTCQVVIRSNSPWRYESDSGDARIWPPPPDWLEKGRGQRN